MRDEWERVAAPITASHHRLTAFHPPTHHPGLGVSPPNLNANVFLFMDLITVCLQYLHACQVEWAGGGLRACACVYVESKEKKKLKGPIIMFTSADGKSRGCNDQ